MSMEQENRSKPGRPVTGIDRKPRAIRLTDEEYADLKPMIEERKKQTDAAYKKLTAAEEKLVAAYIRELREANSTYSTKKNKKDG